MAERIEQRLEDRVPELEQLERVGLFTHKEIRAILRKASALEYKIQRRALRKEDFINYIQYEINLLELIKKRRARIGYSFKKEEIEFSILQRVHSLFKRATGKWKDDVQLWLSHVAFCKQWNTKHQLSKVFSSMLAIHPNKPALWIMAAKWEMETRLSSESARHLFLRALRFHPECPKLYQEYFRMELMNAEKQRKEKKEFERAKMDLGEFSYSEEILNGEMARIIYRDAAQKIKGAEFHLAVLSIAKLFDFTQDLQKEILESLQTKFADDPLTWDYMARRELELGSLQSTEHSTKQMKVSEMTQREERCCAVFEEAVGAVPTEDMWKCYITFCLERYNRKTNSAELKQKRLERALNVFDKAHESSLLPEALYKLWLQLLLEFSLSEKAAEVAEAVTKRFSLSVEAWQMRLQVLIQLKSDDVPQCFEEAIKHMKSKGTLPLWTLWVEWSEGTNSKEDTEALYQRSLRATTPAETVTMKEKYLDWTYRNHGYKKVKKVFTSLCENHPFSIDFFKKMIQIEKEQVMAAAVERASSEEEQLLGKREAMTWKPKKEYLLKNMPHILDNECEEGEFSDISQNESDVSGSPIDYDDLHPDIEELGGEASTVSEAETFPVLQTASVYEAEDWDKELEDSECNPYDTDDLLYGSFQENNLLASYSWQEDSFYNPGCHHAASITFTPPVRATEIGQFDDADE